MGFVQKSVPWVLYGVRMLAQWTGSASNAGPVSRSARNMQNIMRMKDICTIRRNWKNSIQQGLSLRFFSEYITGGTDD